MIQKLKVRISNLLKGGFFHILFGNTLTKMIAFISSIVIARLVSKADYAYLTYADNIYSYINFVAGLGMSTAILKYCSAAKSKEEDKAYFWFTIKYGSAFQVVISIALLFYVYLTPVPYPQARSIFLLLVLYPLLSHIFTSIMNYARAHLNNKLYVNMSVIQTVVVFLGSLGFVWLLGIKGIVTARYLATFVAVLFSIKFIRSLGRGVQKEKLNRQQIKGFMELSISMMLASFFSVILANNEQMLVDYLIADEVTTANYKVANLIPSQLIFVTNSIIVYYFPLIARIEDKSMIWKQLKKIGLLCGGISFIISLGGIIFSPIIVQVAYGNKYEDALSLFPVFWIIHAINSGVRLLPMNMLAAIGKTKFNAVMSFFTCIIHFIVDYISIKAFGILGVGIASGLVYAVFGIVYWIYMRRVCKKEKSEVKI